MKRMIQIALFGFAACNLVACHTAAGLGQDIEEVGEEMEEAAHEVHN